ncbi:uncharacterized protein RCO7_08023 [Rhynchosporium graminicola]|uniref:Uncharacterized protein n=1 Tax=Rhynchosporium graminicola TaxID=2792576 RepID=A0A1E1K6X4_9HELO|nr:uncharacterized protein RCO7_08023 [Rhynchosporium commune]
MVSAFGDHLRSVKRPRRTFYHDLLKDAPNPGLFVEDSGPVAFPFLERDIKCIIEANERSALENKTAETPTRKTNWEVPCDKIKLNNPSWERLIAVVLSSISSELEIEPTGRGILATRPFLVLYGPNSTVVPFKSPSESPVFGFLDVTLPSKYTEGELHIQHDGRKEAVPSIERSEYDCYCLAWFANVVSTSSPISEGYRLVLRYTLEHRLAGPTCCAIPRAQEVMKLQSILTSWTKQKDQVAHKVLGYVLTDRYENAQLDHIKFSNSDQLAVAQLIEACAEAGFFLSLSNLTARIASQADREKSSKGRKRGDCPRDSFQLGRIVDLDGKELLGCYRMDFKEEDIVQDRPFEDQGYILDEELEEYDDCAIKLYRKTVVILMPLEARVSFLYGPSAPDYNARVKEILAHFCSFSKSVVEFVELENDIRQICDAVLLTISWNPEHVGNSGYARDVHSWVLKAIRLLGDQALLRRAFPIGFTSLDDFEVLYSASKNITPNWLNDSLGQQIADTTDFLSKSGIIGKIEKFISSIWIDIQYESAIEGLNFGTNENFEEVIHAAACLENDSRLETILIPSIKRRLLGNEMIMLLLSQLSVEKQIPNSVFEALVPQSIEHFVVNKHKAQFYQSMSTILLHSHDLGLSMQFQQAISKISHAASKASLDELENDYLGFLGKFVATIDKANCMALPIVQGLCQHVINLIALKCAPIKNKWVLSPCGCGCSDCNELDAFLNNHLVDGAQFKRTTEQRAHLEQRLRTYHPTRVRTVTVMVPEIPYILRVIKVFSPTDSPIQHWFEKYEALRASMTSLGTKRLQYLLGRHYGTLMTLTPIWFSPVIPKTVSEIVDLTVRDGKASLDVPITSSATFGNKPGSRFDSAPISRDVPGYLVSDHKTSSTTSNPPIRLPFPSQILASTTNSTTLDVHNDHAAGHILMSQRTESPAAVAQAIVRPSLPRHNAVQRSVAKTTATKGADNLLSNTIIVKTENLAPSSLQSTSMQRPGKFHAGDTFASVSTESLRTPPPPGRLGTLQNGSLALSKRKDPPASVEKSSSSNSSLEPTKRIRVENPANVPGGVWGSLDAPSPPLPDNHVPPHPPVWLVKSLAALRPRFPGHQFKAIMRHLPVSRDTKVPHADPAFGYPLPADLTYMWIPRIQCSDCPAKLYIPGSGKSVTNFVIHLKAAMHASNVQKRLQQQIS